MSLLDPLTASFVLAVVAPAFRFLAVAHVDDFVCVWVTPEFYLNVSASALFAFDYHSCCFCWEDG